MDSYRYQALPGPEYIRLLTIQPGREPDEIDLHIGFQCLAEDPTPDFEALSYTWGSQDDFRPIYVWDGGARTTMSVAPNLHIALQHLRYRDQPRIIWIDAVSINQSDRIEKASQVALIGRIYAGATRVVAWLGPEANDSTRAMDVLGDMGKQIILDWENYTMEPTPQAIDPSWAADEATALAQLLSRPWFQRLWIRQEIYLANSEAIVKCGHCDISWLRFRDALACLFFKGLVTVIEANVPLIDCIGSLQSFIFQSSSLSLKDLRDDFAGSKCSDPRDRIYAVLNLLNPDERALIRPDYNLEAGKVFEDAFLKYPDLYGDLGLLAHCQLNPDSHASTWVPDWSTGSETEVSIQGYASSGIAAWFESRSSGVLQVSGKIVTSVSGLHPFNISPRLNNRLACESLQSGLLNKLKEGRSLHQPFLESLAQALVANTFEEKREPPDSRYPALARSVTLLDQLMSGWDVERTEYASNREFLNVARMHMAGRQLFEAPGDRFGLAPKSAQLGDIITVIVGCDVPIMLRGLQNGTYKVVGQCFMSGIAEGEALLGSLPEATSVVQVSDEGAGLSWAFKEDGTNKLSFLDPRLEPLIAKVHGNIHTSDTSHRQKWELDPRQLMELGIGVEYLDLV